MIELQESLKEKFKEILSENSNVEQYGVPPYILDDFQSSKEHIYKKFNEELWVKKKIYIDRSKDPVFKAQVLSDFLERAGELGVDDSEGFFAEMNQITPDEFAENKFKGIKLTKFMKKIINNVYLSTQIENEYSRQLMKLKPLEGYLTLSINPVDYITMSESGYGWDSCQSLHGDYAAGTLSLLSDDCTMVAYITTKEKKKFSFGYWWPKKWRTLVHLDSSHNTFVFNRHYPYYSQDIEDELIALIKEVWSDKSLIHYKEYPVGEPDFIYANENSVHYNDFSLHKARVLSAAEDDEPEIIIGAPVSCFCCVFNCIMEADRFICMDCEESFLDCDECGERVNLDDAVNTSGFTVWCQRCADEFEERTR